MSTINKENNSITMKYFGCTVNKYMSQHTDSTKIWMLVYPSLINDDFIPILSCIVLLSAVYFLQGCFFLLRPLFQGGLTKCQAYNINFVSFQQYKQLKLTFLARHLGGLTLRDNKN